MKQPSDSANANGAEQAPPKIEFPCENYPIKVMGTADEVYQDQVLVMMEKHAPGFDRSKVACKASSKGTFMSVTVFITATGVDQLKALFEDLKTLPQTRMVI